MVSVSHRIDGDSGRSSRLALLSAAVFAVLWIPVVAGIVSQLGVFSWIGYDFGVQWSAARAMLAGGAAAAYHKGTVAVQAEILYPYMGQSAATYQVAPAPYAPLFFLVLAPFTQLPALTAYLVWEAANFAAAAWVLYGLSGRFRDLRASRVARTVLCLGCFPMAFNFFVGQPTGFLLLALARGLLAFERGQDARAGLWLGLLLLKPQYAVCMIPVLAWKRRWRALWGVGAVALAIGSTSVAWLGAAGVRDYLDLTQSMASFWSRDVFPQAMIGWRGLLSLLLSPSVPDATATTITDLFSLATVAVLPIVWRGAWAPQTSRFGRQMLATWLVTLLVNYHNHAYGGALLLAPGLIVASSGEAPRLVRAALRIGLVLPTIVFAITWRELSSPIASMAVTILMVLGLAGLVGNELATQKARIIRLVDVRRLTGTTAAPGSA